MSFKFELTNKFNEELGWGHRLVGLFRLVLAEAGKVPSNYSFCFGKPGSTTIGQPPASKENGFNLMVNELNKKTKPSKKESSSNGFLVKEEDKNNSIITISQKLNIMCPCYGHTDHIFGSLPNVNPLGGEATPTLVIDEQLFRFTKEDEDIREVEDINPITNSDNITNEIPVPSLATPIDTSTYQKTSNSWNLNANSCQKKSKSALPPRTYAELNEAKTDCK
ncbi:hypothetical protein PPACK8108_LOCUS7732 [Phakopsora pachyrhizi]|uniref:Uncharacterized protein n=1 Tax=Phakopsora pachyrhizi TaxID=170000 RepID=A0AAV0AVP3_PHAPC|nr:hypothetical protein PPACK8108_LOCUS7732 [Phakopsora pachyrhizi]